MSRRCGETRQPRTVGSALRSVPLVELSGPRIDSNGNSIRTAARTFVLSQGAKRYRMRTRSETWMRFVQMAVNYGLKNPYSPVHCIEPKLRAVRGPGGLPGKVSKSSITEDAFSRNPGIKTLLSDEFGRGTAL